MTPPYCGRLPFLYGLSIMDLVLLGYRLIRLRGYAVRLGPAMPTHDMTPRITGPTLFCIKRCAVPAGFPDYPLFYGYG